MEVHKVVERRVGLEQDMVAAGRPEYKVVVVAVVPVPVMGL